MSLKDILRYQEIDQKVYKEEIALSRSAEVQKINLLKQQIQSAQQNLLKLDREAEEDFTEIEKIEAAIEKINKQYKSGAELSGAETLEQIDAAEREYNALSEQIANMEKDAKRIFKRLNDISSEATKQFDTGTSSSKDRAKYMAIYNDQLKNLREKFREQTEQMNLIKEKIEPELFEMYKNLRDNKKMPAFVIYNNGNCSACGMHIQIEVEQKLKNPGDYAECPVCRRIVYLAE